MKVEFGGEGGGRATRHSFMNTKHPKQLLNVKAAKSNGNTFVLCALKAVLFVFVGSGNGIVQMWVKGVGDVIPGASCCVKLLNLFLRDADELSGFGAKYDEGLIQLFFNIFGSDGLLDGGDGFSQRQGRTATKHGGG